LDGFGRELAPENDDWIVQEVSSAGIRISNVRTGHVTTLGADHIHHFTSNPGRSTGGLQYGFLVLHVQIFLSGNELQVRPNSRPGEAVKPAPVQVVEKWVDIRYPADSGLQRNLEAVGYRVTWSLETHLSRRIDLEGWEVVMEPDEHGRLTVFRLKDRPANQTLIKKRNG
jgi:hypothetical protein